MQWKQSDNPINMPRKKQATAPEPAEATPQKPLIPNAPVCLKNGVLVSNDTGLVYIDKSKNKIIIDGNKVKKYLAKHHYKTFQKLFTIDIPNKQLICERDYTLHRNIKLNAYAFDYGVISKAKQCTHVLLKEVRYEKVFRYLIPIKYIFSYGKYQRSAKKVISICMSLEALEKYYLVNNSEKI